MSQDYFSGSQVSVFINDIWIDDAAAYNLTVQEAKMPIYGYGSQFYDFVAKGIVTINGTLAINYRHPNYLYIILANKERRSQDKIKQNAITDQLNRMSASQELFGQLNNLSNIDDKDLSEVSKYYKQKYWNEAIPQAAQTDTLDHDPFEMFFTYGVGSTGVIEKIEGVELLGRSKIIESNGQPIMEQYSFIARRYL